jgi:pimeloyl-ACP methyl ester carboxylesterase
MLISFPLPNRIQGHPLGRKFKALVCHDGITSFAGGQYSTDELYFPFHDLGGAPWDNQQCYHIRADNPFTLSSTPVGSQSLTATFSTSPWKKWDPAAFFHEWQTPQLVIHSAKDYRLPISEGLAAYNVLQARGVESQFLMFPDENHWVLQPENSLVWHKTALNFVNKYVGKEPFTTEDPESDPEYFGGVKEEAKAAQEEAGKMPTLGQVMI